MLRLQEKAHISLDDFRKGKSLSSARHMSPDPAEGDDELDTLGGKTRLVAKKEASLSPRLLDRSPTSLNPVVPLPLPSSSQGGQVHPSVFEYLRTFGNHQLVSEPEPMSQTYTDSSIYGLTALHEQTSFQTQRQSQLQQEYESSPQGNIQYHSMAEAGSLPQYFPVYDYAPAVSQENYHRLVQMESDMMNVNTPEANMHTTWQDFVAGLGMN
jgi:hypothetical protein